MTSDFKVLMQRFHDQTITPEELAEFCKLINSDMYDEYWGNELFSSLYTEPNAIVGKDQPALERAYSNAVRAREIALQRATIPVAPRKTQTLKLWMATAAVITLAILATVRILVNDNSTQQMENTLVFQGPARFELPDKSRVLLDDNTTLTYNAAAFGKGTREVTLTGQAFFEVKPDASAPFLVRSEEVTTRVLGTSFNVNAQPRKNKRVTVSEGKVEVEQRDGQRGNITPGQQIMVGAQGYTFMTHNVDADTVLAWKKKFLLFDRISLAEAARRIEERFGVKIDFANEDLKTVIIDAAFVSEEDMKMSHVLSVVSIAANATFAVEHGIITIRAKDQSPSF